MTASILSILAARSSTLVTWTVVLAALNAWASRFVGGWASLLGNSCRLQVLPSMTGKFVLVTGGNAGVGFGVVREVARLGATVILCCRSLARGEAAKVSLPLDCQSRVEVMELDLASKTSIHAFADRFKSKHALLHVLVLNAGIARSFLGNQGFRRTQDGFEEMIGVNFLGHFLLTQLLLPVLTATSGARIVACSSVAALNSYPQGIDTQTWTERCHNFSDWMQYGQSKLALILFIRELQRRQPSLLCLACHPGVIDGTTLMHNGSGSWLEWLYSAYLFRCLAMSPGDAWRSVVYTVATNDTLQPGGFYCPIGKLSPWPWPWLASSFQRVAALQVPVNVGVTHNDLWELAEAAIDKQCGGSQ